MLLISDPTRCQQTNRVVHEGPRNASLNGELNHEHFAPMALPLNFLGLDLILILTISVVRNFVSQTKINFFFILQITLYFVGIEHEMEG